MIAGGACEALLQRLDVVEFGCLNAKLGAQQIAWILRGVARDGSVAGRFGLGEPTEAAVAAGEVVPKSGSVRCQFGGAPIECICLLMATERGGYIGQPVVGVRDPGGELGGSGDDGGSVGRSPQPPQDGGDQTVTGE